MERLCGSQSWQNIVGRSTAVRPRGHGTASATSCCDPRNSSQRVLDPRLTRGRNFPPMKRAACCAVTRKEEPVPEDAIMFVARCSSILTLLALSADGNVLTRGDFLRHMYVIPEVISYVPQNDVEVWFGWRKIHMGEHVFDDVGLLTPSVKFQAPSDKFFTVLEAYVHRRMCQYVTWLRINIPGSDVSRGSDIIERRIPYGADFGTMTVLAIEQENVVDIDDAKQIVPLPNCSIPKLFTALRLKPAMAINVYERRPSSCELTTYLPSPTEDPSRSNCMQWNWNEKLYSDLSTGGPYALLQVEYMAGESIRSGQCLANFLTTTAPAVVRLAATSGAYYMLYFIAYCVTPTPNWLRLNIPASDFTQGDEAVPYTVMARTLFGPCVFLLFSQGTRRIAVDEVKQLPSLSWKSLSDKFQLGYPVAANHFWSYYADGVVPDTRPSLFTTIQTGSSSRTVIKKTMATPSALNTGKAQETTTGISATRGGASMLLKGWWFTVLAGWLIVFSPSELKKISLS